MKKKNLKLTGIMLAGVIVVVSFVYAIDIQPIVIGGPGGFSVYSELKTFESYEEFTEFLMNSSSGYYYGYGASLDWSNAIPKAAVSLEAMDDDLVDYSQTNVQVTGVDEPDIVKTDGTYLYIVSGNKVIIVKAIPAEDAVIECEIEVNESLTIINIFISGNRLVIFSEEYNFYPLYRGIAVDDIEIDDETPRSAILPYPSRSDNTQIKIYDLEDLDNPKLVKDIVVAGHFSSARMIDGYVYLITVQYNNWVYLEDDQTVVPTILINGEEKTISLKDISYIDSPDYDTLTNIVSVNINDLDEDVNTKVFSLGYSNIIYVSSGNIYITSSTTSYDNDLLEEIIDEVLMPYFPESLSSELDLVDQLSIEDYQKQTVKEWILQGFADEMDEDLKNQLALEILKRIDRTIIHRIGIDDGQIRYEAQGTVPGHASNQFSLSENGDYLRISTTMQNWRVSDFVPGVFESQNSIYVLNMDLEIVGSVEGLAPGEQIYATRFLGDKCYLVTFRQIDPFFVIDLSDPTNPTVLGELKIPGFSTYLHPYDETHVIGIGRDGIKVKVSLFDVTDVSTPIELSKYEVEYTGDDWWRAQSYALDEHKAFLFDKEKNLLVIPIGSYYKQSAYVFDVSVDDGVELKGSITHYSKVDEQDDKDEYDYYWTYDDSYSVKRALYIEDVLYTISDNIVKMNSLDDLSEINSIKLN